MTYAASGVDIDAGEQVVSLIKRDMRRTYGPRVLSKHGGFAGCFRLDYNEDIFHRNYSDPVLVSCTDGVGSKVKLAHQMGVLDTIGQDCVAMNVNDLIVQGAEPLFMLDYIGIHKVEPTTVAAIVRGVADGCKLAGCALLGGETAELPDIYKPGDFDLAGFAVGVCELKRIIDGSRAEAGDVFNRSRLEEVLDLDRTGRRLTVRNRRPGDVFHPLGGGSRKLKRFLIDLKVPERERDAVPLLVADGEIAISGHGR